MSGRFYKVFDKVLADKNLSHSEIILYSIIVRLSQNSEKKCYASNKALADILRCSKSSINKYLDKLTKHGYIKRTLHYVEGTKQIDKRYITPMTIYTVDLQEDIPTDDNGIYRKSDTGYSDSLQESIPSFYQGSKINIDKEFSKISEKEKSNNFFLNLANNDKLF